MIPYSTSSLEVNRTVLLFPMKFALKPLRRLWLTQKPFPFTSLADPHPSTPFLSHRCKKPGPQGVVLATRYSPLATSFTLSPIIATLAEKHRGWETSSSFPNWHCSRVPTPHANAGAPTMSATFVRRRFLCHLWVVGCGLLARLPAQSWCIAKIFSSEDSYGYT